MNGVVEIEHVTADIKVSDFIKNYRDIDKFANYCKQCSLAKSWSCPPFDFNVDTYISGYSNCRIIGTKIHLDPDINTKQINKIITEIRLTEDQDLLLLENKTPKSLACFAGRCQLCTECQRVRRRPCNNPTKLRPSLEALGFDLNKTSEQMLNTTLQWYKTEPPKYIMLISALFYISDF